MSSKFKKIDAIIAVILLIIAGIVLIRVGYIQDPIDPTPPNINFFQDDAEKKLIVKSVDREIFWFDINIVETEGECDTSHIGAKVVEGDEITNCEGTVTIIYNPTDDTLGSWTFTPKKQLPESVLPGTEHAVKPADEGDHYKEFILGGREWWYYTVVFSQDSDLPGWTLTVSFNHMARNDLDWSKPDMLFVVLTGPEGERYGGIVERKRPILGEYAFLDKPVLEATSSEKSFRVSFEDSYIWGKWPNWHIHIEEDDFNDKKNKLLIDLQFFAPSSPYWTHNNRIIEMSNAKIASYVFLGCEVTGSVEIDGFTKQVKGIGHHEHTWATGFILTKTLIRGWDWCHITMENGWNIYYSKYYLASQLRSTKETNFDGYTNIIVTTDQGNKITILEDANIKIIQSDDVNFLLKVPLETQVEGTTSLKQILLDSYDIYLNLNIKAGNTFDYTWKKLTYVGMKIGECIVTGSISWSDDNGDHEVQLDGIGTIWNMRH
jgi:predicted secreted hydrolase